MNLLEHPYWSASDPSRRNLVRVSPNFPSSRNPFAHLGVVIRAAYLSEVRHSKVVVGREGIFDGVRSGRIQPLTQIIEATSGNTGDGMAQPCLALGLQLTAVISPDVPRDKVSRLEMLGVTIVRPGSGESAVETARRLGQREGWYNPDQYSGNWNFDAHRKYHAPQLWDQTPVSLLALPGGTMGSSIGFRQYADDISSTARILPVLCRPGVAVPGARTLDSIRRDVRLPWENFWKESDLEYGSRKESFRLSYATWPHLEKPLGPSFGLAYAGTIRYLTKLYERGQLDELRRKNGLVYVVIFGPDQFDPYLALYDGELDPPDYSRRAISTTVQGWLDY